MVCCIINKWSSFFYDPTFKRANILEKYNDGGDRNDKQKKEESNIPSPLSAALTLLCVYDMGKHPGIFNVILGSRLQGQILQLWNSVLLNNEKSR